MFNATLLDTVETAVHKLSGQVLDKVFFFHDVRVTCQTNHPTILATLDEMLGMFPEPAKIEAEVTYAVMCHESSAHFPLQLPGSRKRTETVRLLTNTKLKSYQDLTSMTEYQSYEALQPVNGAVLTAISQSRNVVLIQLEKPELYQATFLRRYVFLLALGQIMGRFGFEPCHAAAITSPWGSQQGALIIGESGSGKTTLSLGCASMGCGFLGDDLVMLRKSVVDGTISAYAITHEFAVRSSSLKLWDTLNFLHSYPVDLRDKRYCSIEQVRSGVSRLHTPIRLLLFPSLTTGTRSAATRMSKANALQQLIDMCMSKTNKNTQVQAKKFLFLSQLAEQAPSYHLAIAQNASDGPQLVRSLFTGEHDD
jgi:hypothetical protein